MKVELITEIDFTETYCFSSLQKTFESLFSAPPVYFFSIATALPEVNENRELLFKAPNILSTEPILDEPQIIIEDERINDGKLITHSLTNSVTWKEVLNAINEMMSSCEINYDFYLENLIAVGLTENGMGYKVKVVFSSNLS